LEVGGSDEHYLRGLEGKRGGKEQLAVEKSPAQQGVVRSFEYKVPFVNVFRMNFNLDLWQRISLQLHVVVHQPTHGAAVTRFHGD